MGEVLASIAYKGQGMTGAWGGPRGGLEGGEVGCRTKHTIAMC